MSDINIFIKKTVFFVLLIFIFLAPSLLILNISGELLPLNRIISLQKNDKTSLFGIICSNPDVEYKIINTLIRKPKILVLGSSRVMQFKDFFFRDTFYNAGGAISGIGQAEIFITKLIENNYTPEILIIGLDQNFFNPNRKQAPNDDYNSRIEKDKQLDLLGLTKNTYRDMVLGKLNLFKILGKNNNIGINAIQNNNGFMYDGSYNYGKIYIQDKNVRDYTFKDIRNRIEQEKSPFEYSRAVDSASLANLKNLLKISRAHHIKVVAFLPPFAPTIYKEMEKSKKYEYLSRLPEIIRQITDDFQAELFDFTYMPETTNQEYIDGFHGSDVVYLKILSKMAKNTGTLSSVTDQNDLEQMEKNRISNLLVK